MKYVIVAALMFAGCAHAGPSPTDLELARLQRIQQWQIRRLEVVQKQLHETEEKCNKVRQEIHEAFNDIKL